VSGSAGATIALWVAPRVRFCYDRLAMGMDYLDYEREAALEKFQDEVISDYLERFGDDWASQYFDDHVKQFTWDRMRSYFLQHPNVMESAVHCLNEAKTLLGVSPRSALVLACSAIEVATKYVILNPFLQGLVHTEELAPLIGSLISGRVSPQMEDIFLAIVSRQSQVDLKKHRRPGASTDLTNETKSLFAHRNEIVHRGAIAQPRDAQQAVDVSAELIEVILPKVFSSLGLKVDGDRLVDL
jgi:hypothetical protein